jgi:hypothetical protein
MMVETTKYWTVLKAFLVVQGTIRLIRLRAFLVVQGVKCYTLFDKWCEIG